MPALRETELAGFPRRQGKVRDLYDLGDRLLLIATDRISAFDWVLPTAIPDKGRVLTQISLFWFDYLGVENHILSTNLQTAGLPDNVDISVLEGRTLIVRKAEVVPIECVVRGYLEGSGWKEYRQSGTVCGISLPAGLQQGSQLPMPIFTPATKEDTGHDVNISFDEMCRLVGENVALELRERSIDVYRRANDHAQTRGLILADTKLEWGWYDGRLILVDEVLTPDSSRFWYTANYAPGGAQASLDKQFVREWLEQSGWDKNSPPPELPAEIVERTRSRYIEAFERLSGREFLWK